MRVKQLIAWLEKQNPEATVVRPAFDHQYVTVTPAAEKAVLLGDRDLFEYFGEEWAIEGQTDVVDVITFGL